MVAVFDAVGPSSAGASTTSGTSLTWAHTCSGTNRLLIVGVAVGAASSDSMTTSVTFAGVAMTSRGKVHCGSGTTGYIEFFSLINPTTTASSSVVVTLTAAATISAGSVSFTGANQTAPLGAVFTGVNAAETTTPTVSLTGTTSGNPIIDAVAWGSGTAVTAPTAPTLKWQRATNSSSRAGDGAQSVRTAPGGSVTLTYTFSPADSWGIVAAEVLPAPVTAAPVPFLTQYSSFH